MWWRPWLQPLRAQQPLFKDLRSTAAPDDVDRNPMDPGLGKPMACTRDQCCRTRVNASDVASRAMSTSPTVTKSAGENAGMGGPGQRLDTNDPTGPGRRWNPSRVPYHPYEVRRSSICLARPVRLRLRAVAPSVTPQTERTARPCPRLAPDNKRHGCDARLLQAPWQWGPLGKVIVSNIMSLDGFYEGPVIADALWSGRGGRGRGTGQRWLPLMDPVRSRPDGS
jgi:hypothetical protein